MIVAMDQFVIIELYLKIVFLLPFTLELALYLLKLPDVSWPSYYQMLTLRNRSALGLQLGLSVVVDLFERLWPAFVFH